MRILKSTSTRFKMDAVLASRNPSEVAKLASNASEIARRASELACRLWKILRDFKPQQAETGLHSSQSEARIAQVE